MFRTKAEREYDKAKTVFLLRASEPGSRVMVDISACQVMREGRLIHTPLPKIVFECLHEGYIQSTGTGGFEITSSGRLAGLAGRKRMTHRSPHKLDQRAVA